MLEAATLILFPWLMAFAASTDLFTMTISNRISLALLGGFVLMAACTGLPVAQLFLNLSCGVAMLGADVFVLLVRLDRRRRRQARRRDRRMARLGPISWSMACSPRCSAAA